MDKKSEIKGNIYITNDSLFSYDNYQKGNRRIVAINDDTSNMQVVKIKGLYDENGKLRKNLPPIDNYSCLTKPSGIENRIYVKTSKNKAIVEYKLKKTNCKLNETDMKK